MHDVPAARAYWEQGLAILRPLGEKRFVADATMLVGLSWTDVNEPAKAVPHLEEALATAEALGDRFLMVKSLGYLGAAERLLGRNGPAREHLARALTNAREIHADNVLIVALNDLTLLEQAEGHLEAALASAEEAVALIDAERRTVRGSSQRAVFVATQRKGFRQLIDALWALHKAHPDQGWAAKALAANERARARSLLEMLGEAQANIREGVDPALLKREREAAAALEKKGAEQVRLMSRKHDPAQAEALNQELRALTAQYQDAQAALRAGSPRYAALTQPEPVGPAEIQRELVDDDTLLLEFALGDDRSILWVVSAAGLEAFELPAAAAIDAAARKLYQAWSAPGAADEAETGRRARALSELVLGPVALRLEKKRLVLVTDGALQYIPFAALPAPAAARAQRRPLVADHEIVNLPSASTLAVLRRERAGRTAPSKAVAILADPVFQANDPRVAGAVLAHAVASADRLTRSAKDAGLLSFERLGATRGEADAIAALVEPGQALKALDFEANLELATSAALADYRFVHFASHGLLNSVHPELSGVVLSLVDAKGQPRDGFLQAHDLYNLHLSADLVVLSACQTALGAEVWGEGLVGLVRGFMYAGANRVMATLWKVPDRSSSELMQRLYRAMLTEGLSPAAALRKAQLALLKSRRWSSPIDWAGFSLQGEWK
jgi:CHAT domain-containing protein